jgi:hypothetical protein
MNNSDQSRLVKQNTMLWLAAIVVPDILYYGLSSTKFPWPVVLPFLIVGLMLASNRLLVKACRAAADEPPRK